MAAIVFDRVNKQFGATNAVRDLSLDIDDGEFLVLVGPSGCGKSTALRLLAGLERVTSGNIYIGDRLVTNVPARDRDLAMVFQSYALYPHMSIRDNIGFALRLRKQPKQQIDQRVLDTAALLGIADLVDRKPGQLSGGQRQRVALGRAIVREPAAFLLDEPHSNLDAKLRVQTRAELSKLHERLGTTFVYVTHDQVEAMTMATRIAVLDRGVLQQLGTAAQIYNNPDNLFVAGFIGSPAMNFFDATLTETDAGRLITAGALQVQPSGDLAGRLRAHEGSGIVLGIRPEHIHDPAYLPPGIDPAPVDVTVDVIESMGSETYLHVMSTPGSSGQAEAESHRFVARVDPRSAAVVGQPFRLAIDRDRLHLFDKDTTLAL
jgi:multiple sugar transport system ATP-binding protein